MGFWAGKNISAIGIDFGSESVKLLQIVPDDPPQLVAAACAHIPEQARASNDQYRQWLGGALRELLREGKFKGKRAVASISAAHTYVQHVRLPRTEGVALEDQIESELRGRLPLDPLALVIRHVNVGEVMVDGTARQEVICLAASREAVLRQVNTVRTAGLDIRGMHCEPMAIIEAFSHLFRRAGDQERTTLFIDIGHATTKALIAHGRDLVFAKTIHVAGDHFARHMAERLKIDPAEARLRRIHEAEDESDRMQPAAPPLGVVETAGRRQGAAPVSAAGSHAPIKPNPKLVAGVAPAALAARPAPPTPDTDEVLEIITDELAMCIGYHASMFGGRGVEKIVFLGGESRHIGLCQKIAAALRLPAQLGDPLARLVRTPGGNAPLNVDLRKSQPGWAVALGLCTLPTNL